MKLAEIKRLQDLNPAGRAEVLLDLGSELKGKKRKSLRPGKLPSALNRESITESSLAPAILSLHGMKVPKSVASRRTAGLKRLDHTMETAAGEIPETVFTNRSRKKYVQMAMRRGKGESLEDLAIRQCAVAMFDPSPTVRCCGAYAYWQATGSEACVPILNGIVESEDETERLLAATCLAKVDLKHVRRLQGTAADDRPQTPANAVTRSMTLLVHGTFAMDSEWYQPGGSFHAYIKDNVYADLYSEDDFFFWSGRYHLDEDRLRTIWRQAARKLVSWSQAHPADTFRVIAHSHGNNVVNMATQMGMQTCTLIQLSPPVRDDNLPDLQRVASGRFFTLRARFDPVVTVDGGAHDYRGTAVAAAERRRTVATFSHSASHEQDTWERRNIPSLVTSVCP